MLLFILLSINMVVLYNSDDVFDTVGSPKTKKLRSSEESIISSLLVLMVVSLELTGSL